MMMMTMMMMMMMMNDDDDDDDDDDARDEDEDLDETIARYEAQKVKPEQPLDSAFCDLMFVSKHSSDSASGQWSVRYDLVQLLPSAGTFIDSIRHDDLVCASLT